MQKLVCELLLLAVLCAALTNAVFVEAPDRITLLPESPQLVFNAIYKTSIYANDSTVFDAENSCKDQVLRGLQVALYKSGNNFHTCYSLTDKEVDRFMAIANDTQLLEKFEIGVNKCPEREHFYEFNCYVSEVQTHLQKIYSYIHKPNSSLEWNIQYQLALARYRKLAICTGGELKMLMDVVAMLMDAFAMC